MAAKNPLSRENKTSKSALIFVLVLVASLALVFSDRLSGEAWAEFMTICLPAFGLTEAGRRFAKPGEPGPEDSA